MKRKNKQSILVYTLLLLLTMQQSYARYRLYSCGRLRSKDIPGSTRSAYVQCVDKQGNILFKAHDDSNPSSWFLDLDYNPVTTEAAVAGYMHSSLTLGGTTIDGFINRRNGVLMRWNDSGELLSHYSLKTFRTSYFHRTCLDENDMYASGYAMGHAMDQTVIDLPRDKNTAILVSVNKNSELNWYVNDTGACFGATILQDKSGEYLYWQGCSRVEESNSYYTWIKKIRKTDGEIMWEIKDTDNYFILDRTFHSEMNMSLDFRGNIMATQLNAVPFRNLVTGEVYYEKHLDVVNYDVASQQEIFRTTVVSADGLSNTARDLNYINLWDSQAFVDGSYHIVGTFSRGDLRIHQNDSTTYEQRALTGVDSWHIKVNYKGELEYANWYAGNSNTFIGFVGYDGEKISIGGCHYRNLTIGDSTYIGYSNKAQTFSAQVEDQPQELLVLSGEEAYQDGEVLTDLVVYPNPVAEGGSIRFLNRLRAGIDYELKMIPVDQLTHQAYSIASFKLTQQEVVGGGMYVPIEDNFEEGVYYLMLYAEGELESTTRLVIE